ncbi:MAG: zinc ribbon domain-containing protein [Candidatus Thorarchaeota archaeon]
MSSKSTENTRKGFKFALILFGILEIGGVITGLVFIFSSFADIGSGGGVDLDKMWIGNYILFGVAGALPLLGMPILFAFVNSKRKTIASAVTNMRKNLIGPFAPDYTASGIKKPRFCEYCGFEVRTGERECPECGGPVRTLKGY